MLFEFAFDKRIRIITVQIAIILINIFIKNDSN